MTTQEFQSTLPARGATPPRGTNEAAEWHFNPRSPHGERREPQAPTTQLGDFNPRSPHGERRSPAPAALRPSPYFNPRSPHGERRQGGGDSTPRKAFQSTLPARGATGSVLLPRFMYTFQSTLPARGATGQIPSRCSSAGHFNPRSPHGERLRKVTILSIRIIGFAQKVYHKTVLLRISLAENAVILPEKPRNPVRTSLQKAGGLRFARAIRAARPYSISSPSGA